MMTPKQQKIISWSLILPSFFFVSIYGLNWIYELGDINTIVFIGLVLIVLMACLIKLVMLSR